MNFLYFVAGAKTGFQKPEELPGELPNVLEGASIGCASIPCGPSGTAGILVTSPSDHGETIPGIFDPGVQTWIEGPGYWVGYQNRSKPRPIDLVRPMLVRGTKVVLGGQEWTIPLVHAAIADEPFTLLPRSFRFVDGQTVLKVRDQYEAICQQTMEMADLVLNQGDWRLTEDETLRYDVAVLGINYRVGIAESVALDLFDTRNMMLVPQAALGLLLEKKTADGPSI